MRIIGGTHKGRRLLTAKGNSIRPTSDSLKETVYNWLQNITDWNVLDLFCGTGSMGIEALSRGAGKVVFVDKSTKSVQNTKNNLDLIGVLKDCQVIKEDAVRYIKRFPEQEYDLIIADPPYEYNRYEILLSTVLETSQLVKGGLFLLETSFRNKNINIDNRYTLIKEKRCGDSFIRLLEF